MHSWQFSSSAMSNAVETWLSACDVRQNCVERHAEWTPTSVGFHRKKLSGIVWPSIFKYREIEKKIRVGCDQTFQLAIR
jgi:hypothetical protein